MKDPTQPVECQFPGFWPGTVRINVDPAGLNRIRVEVPTVSQHILPAWAPPIGSAWGIGEGTIIVPDVGAAVWVTFLGGDPNFPYWQPAPPTVAQKPLTPPRPGLRSLETKVFSVQVDDLAGTVRILMKGTETPAIEMTAAALLTLLGGAAGVNIGSRTLTPLDGVVTMQCKCAYTGLIHPEGSLTVRASK